MTSRAALVTIEFRSYWLSGTGGGRGRHLDAVSHRDADGLPAMPMSQVKGTLRETAERLGRDGRAGWSCRHVERIFGRQPEAGEPNEDGAVAFLGDAEIPGANRTGLAGSGERERRRQLYRRVAGTQIDERGSAADRTLRYIEAAVPVTLVGRIEWIAAGAPDPGWIELLDAACAATLAFGKLKNDGYGAAIASVVPAGSASEAVAAGSAGLFSKSHKVLLLMKQNSPAVFSRSAATEGTHATHDAPTGGSLLGWAAAAAGYGNFKDPFAAFHSGAIRFGNAAPLGPDGEVCVPMPKLFMASKHNAGDVEEDGKVGCVVRIGRPAAQANGGAAVQYEHAPSAPFVTAAGHILRSKRGQRLRTATDRGRAAEGQLFGYEHLSAEGWPVFAALLERDGSVCDADWERVLEAFEGRTARLGRARGTGYGGEYSCRLLSAPADTPPVPGGTEGLLRVLALSDLALADEWGVPSAQPDHKMLRLPPAEFVGRDSAMSLARHAAWNGKLGARDMERQVIETGSVLTFRLAAPLADDLPARASVGLWREAGFGQIWIHPPFLRGSGRPCFSDEWDPVTLPGNEGRHAEPGPDSELARWCDRMKETESG